MAMNRIMTMAEKEIRDYAPETDGAGRTAGKYCVYGETERTGFGVCRYDR